MEYFSEMESSTKMPDPKKTDPKKIQELVGIRSKKAVSGSTASGSQRTPIRSGTPTSSSDILRNQPDEAVAEKQQEENPIPRKRLKVTEIRHGIGKEARIIPPPRPQSIDMIPETSTTELEAMAPEEFSSWFTKTMRAARLMTQVATVRMESSASLVEKEETIKKQAAKIEKLEASVKKLDGRRLTLEADLEASRLNLSKAEKMLAARDGELTKVKSELEATKIELANAIKARDDLQFEVDSFAARHETARKDYLASSEFKNEMMSLMTQVMKGGFTNALNEVKAVFPEFEVSSIGKAHLYDTEAVPRYGRYFDDLRSGVSLYEKYVVPALNQEDEEDIDIENQADPNVSDLVPPNP